MRDYKRVLFLSDPHCGHRSGLTPPDWNCVQGNKGKKWWEHRAECYNWFLRQIQDLRPIDVCIVPGDAIEGSDTRSGGTELIVTDRLQQAEMAIQVFETVKAKEYALVRGTPYHTGDVEEFEDSIAKALKAPIGDHEWYDINGKIFDVKHKIGRSAIPHGRATPIERAKLWNTLWSLQKRQPHADVLIRGHVHVCVLSGHYVSGKLKLGMTLPALQGVGTKYGAKECETIVDYGLVVYDVYKGGFSWDVRIADLPSQRAKILRL